MNNAAYQEHPGEKNPFPMPFLLDPDPAATKILDATTSGRKRLTFPLPMALAIKTLALLPDNLYDSLARRMLTGKPRR